MSPLLSEIEEAVKRALAEDQAASDPTTDSIIPANVTGCGILVARSGGILCGIHVAQTVFRQVDPKIDFKSLMEDGSSLKTDSCLAEIAGTVSSILAAERTALNFLQHLSGIATATHRFVKAIDGHHTRIFDTRKTIPGLRVLQKYAVRTGGGHNHRMNLSDGILIKDNHIVAAHHSGLELADIVRKAKQNSPQSFRIEVEVEDLDQTRQALSAGADILLLDNMELEQMTEAVQLAKDRALTEASGGITMEVVEAVAATGVDIISVGSLTHSVKALDMSLDLI